MRGHIRERGRSFTVYVEDDKDAATGKRNQQTVTVRGSRDDAEQELTRLLRAKDTGALVEESKISTREFFQDWLSSIEGSVSPRTFQGYKQIMDTHLLPAFGNIPLRKLRPLHLQAHYSACLREGSRKDGRDGTLSPQTVLHHHRLLHQVLEDAVGWEYIGRNPARVVKPPRIEDREVKVLDAARTAWLVDCARGTRLHIPIQLAVFLGLRRGEVLGCRWSDINWTEREISIRRAVEETKAHGVRLKPPKSKRGLRTLSIPALLFDALQTLKASLPVDTDAFICPGDDSNVWRPSAFTSTYRALLARRGLTGPGFHVLRHGHGTQLARGKMPIDDISRQLGHSRSSFTLNTYIHELGSRGTAAADRINAVYEDEFSKLKSVQ